MNISPTKLFFALYLGCIVVCCYFLATLSKTEILLSINSLANPVLDQWMKITTQIGDGVTMAIIGIPILLFLRLKSTFLWIYAGVLHSFLVQISKKLIFPNEPRPWKVIDPNLISLPENYIPHSNNSFPSGHTATAFCMALLMVIIFRSANVNLRILIVFISISIAIAVGFSRMYLFQHWLIDVVFGSLVGIVSVGLAYGIQNYLLRFPRYNQISQKRIVNEKRN